MKKSLLITSLFAGIVLAGTAVAGSPTEGAAPFDINKLPEGRLKSHIKQLTDIEQEKTKQWMNSFNFRMQDVPFMDVDKQGGVKYVYPETPDEEKARIEKEKADEAEKAKDVESRSLKGAALSISQAELEADPTLAGIVPIDVFALHSLPGSSNTVYLNFKGGVITGTGWNGSVSQYDALPYDVDNNPGAFSDLEKQYIAEVWRRVAEDYAIFDIDVTTEKPLSFGPTTGHIMITGKVDLNSNPLPSNTAGGIAYQGVWGTASYTTYQPAFVYHDNLASLPEYIAEAASHEFGHNFGLTHDGSGANEYADGIGSGLVSWAPIMGSSYYSDITQWSNGDYVGADNFEDDIAILASMLGYRTDDHANVYTGATALLTDDRGRIAASNPKLDATNLRPDNKGVIGSRDDVDVFSFDTLSGDVSITINPAWYAFSDDSVFRGANLDIKVRLLDGTGVEIMSADPADDTLAVINATLGEGRYYIEVDGTGNTVTPYSDYGSLGQYFISGQVITSLTDQVPPSPTVMTIEQGNTTKTKSSVTLVATTAVDDVSNVSYQFNCISGGNGCSPSGWQASRTYTFSNLAANTTYTFEVKARDESGNETQLSAPFVVVTSENTAPDAKFDIVRTDMNVSVAIDVLENDSDTDGDVMSVINLSTPAGGLLTLKDNIITYYPDDGFTGNDQFTYDAFDGVLTTTATVYIAVGDVIGEVCSD